MAALILALTGLSLCYVLYTQNWQPEPQYEVKSVLDVEVRKGEVIVTSVSASIDG